jgi:diguanylate cyclase (GGDEF)-like protein/PAS domain S-box-containing protein
MTETQTNVELILATITDGIVVVDQRGIVLYANQSAEHIFERGDLLGRDLAIPLSHSASYQDINLIRRSGIGWAELRSSPITWNGQAAYVIGVRDITERKQVENELRKLSLAVEQSPSSIRITNLDGNIEYVNDTFVKMTGYSRDEVIGNNSRIFQSGKTPQAIHEDMLSHLTRGEIWRGKLINKCKDGSEYIESIQISPVRQADGRITHYVEIMENITEKIRTEEHIERLVHFDQLTGLPNRSLLSDRFKYALSLAQRGGEPLAVMFLDLDHFKNINDTLGHTIGDQLLMEMARRIKATLREEDTVSRQGGDEFMLILHATDADGAAYVATKLIEAVLQPYIIGQHELITTASVGIAIYPNDGEDLETLSMNADTAMYRVKRAGRNNFCFYTPEMQAHSARALQLANALRHALERNELQLHYQPQLSLQDGHIVGAEALLRWRHPELGMISPAEFIPIAEDSGQIIPIGEWVLRTAAKQLKDWIDSGLPPLVMAVNLSSVQFRQANITGLITHILDEVKLPHKYLELELTEAVAMGNPLVAIEVMNQLHKQGIRMSIDDFGTGYSSLSYLKKFKVYKLKIDQSFVRDLTDDPDDKAIVSAIINMASSLGIQTIAEGVETAGQLTYLRLQGCDEAQGYYFSKPLPAEQFEAFVRKGQESFRPPI